MQNFGMNGKIYTKLLGNVTCLDDCHALQHDIDALINWSHIWGMDFNPKKYCVMSFSKAKHKIIYNYSMKGKKLNRQFQFVDLEITVCDSMRWDTHINTMVTKAYRRLRMVKRCVGHSVSSNTKLMCYRSLVRPLLESGSTVCTVNNKNLLLKIKGVQRRATKYICSDYNTNYDVRLKVCDLLPLYLRREYLDMVLVYNHTHHLVDMNIELVFAGENVYLTRGNVDNLSLVSRRILNNNHANFFTQRIVSTWNKIPYNIISLELSDTLKNRRFKKELKIWMVKDIFGRFNVDNTCMWLIAFNCNGCKVI
jgi:hypothetical protein